MLITSLCDNGSLIQIRFRAESGKRNYFFTRLMIVNKKACNQDGASEKSYKKNFRDICFISIDKDGDISQIVQNLYRYGGRINDYHEMLNKGIISSAEDKALLSLVHEYQQFLSDNCISFYPNYITWMKQMSSNSSRYIYYLVEDKPVLY